MLSYGMALQAKELSKNYDDHWDPKRIALVRLWNRWCEEEQERMRIRNERPSGLTAAEWLYGGRR